MVYRCRGNYKNCTLGSLWVQTTDREISRDLLGVSMLVPCLLRDALGFSARIQ